MEQVILNQHNEREKDKILAGLKKDEILFSAGWR
jgi:hypothetical protein